MKCIKKLNQRLRILKKIRSQLPNYHPETGEPLDWNIYLGKWKGDGYDNKTGELLNARFSPTIEITQRRPSCLTGHHVYRYNWGSRKIETIKNARWFS